MRVDAVRVDAVRVDAVRVDAMRVDETKYKEKERKKKTYLVDAVRGVWMRWGADVDWTRITVKRKREKEKKEKPAGWMRMVVDADGGNVCGSGGAVDDSARVILWCNICTFIIPRHNQRPTSTALHSPRHNHRAIITAL